MPSLILYQLNASEFGDFISRDFNTQFLVMLNRTARFLPNEVHRQVNHMGQCFFKAHALARRELNLGKDVQAVFAALVTLLLNDYGLEVIV